LCCTGNATRLEHFDQNQENRRLSAGSHQPRHLASDPTRPHPGGNVAELSAMLANGRCSVTALDTGGTLPITAPDRLTLAYFSKSSILTSSNGFGIARRVTKMPEILVVGKRAWSVSLIALK